MNQLLAVPDQDLFPRLREHTTDPGQPLLQELERRFILQKLQILRDPINLAGVDEIAHELAMHVQGDTVGETLVGLLLCELHGLPA